ncbi:DnaB helicase C-terminal domain-containing protein [bacterium]|nr:DnaB helicase C-terminal domain-containing protein [bacterium]
MTFSKTSAELARFLLDLNDGKQEVSYAGGTVGDDFVLAPGRITIIGAPPGAGKTALATQIAFEALDRHSELTLCIANAEMEVRELLKRDCPGGPASGTERSAKDWQYLINSGARRSSLPLRNFRRQCNGRDIC